MTDNDPVNIEILKLIAADLTRKGTLAGLTNVLTGDLDVLIKQSFDRSDVNADWSHNDFQSGLVELRLVQNILD